MAGNPDAKTGLALARVAYLFGVGNGGVPLRNKAKLLEISTVHEDTLPRHLKIWDEEAERMARTAGDCTLGFSLREEAVESHKADVEWLRTQTDALKSEVSGLENLLEHLTEVVENIAENLTLTGSDYDSIRGLLEGYFTASLNRQKLLGLFLAIQKRWQDSSAVSSTIAAYETQIKEIAKRKAKQAYPENPGEGSGSPADAGRAASANTGIFRRGSGGSGSPVTEV